MTKTSAPIRVTPDCLYSPGWASPEQLNTELNDLPRLNNGKTIITITWGPGRIDRVK